MKNKDASPKKNCVIRDIRVLDRTIKFKKGKKTEEEREPRGWERRRKKRRNTKKD